MSPVTVTSCITQATDWAPGAAPKALAFQTRGLGLDVELCRWDAGDVQNVAASLGEEMGAVLEGSFEMRCGDECHELHAGSGILIPPGVSRCWRLLSDSGVLYRVVGRVEPHETAVQP
jgi:hypothetical protein